MAVNVEVFLTPFFPEPESLFESSITVMIDVLRASSTVAVALNNHAKEVIPVDSIEKAVKIYSSLSKEVRFLGGERNGIKPTGFDAGNSPFEYNKENVVGKNVIFTTTNGTRIFLKAKLSKFRIIGCFVNISVVTDFIKTKIANPNNKIDKIYFLCAGNDGNVSYEDILCAGNYISLLNKVNLELNLSDSAMLSANLYEKHKDNYIEFLRTRTHSLKLINLGFAEDIDFCLTKDICPVIPLVNLMGIKKYENENIQN